MQRSLASVFVLVFSLMSAAHAEAPSPETMAAARDLVLTLKQTDQYKALFPGILFSFRRTLTQDRPEIERDFDLKAPALLKTYSKYYDGMVDSAAELYAKNFSVEELRAIEAFYRSPAGQKYLEKSRELSQLSQKIGDEASRVASEELKARMILLLRENGHKF